MHPCLAKVIVYTKDEYDLIEPFIKYYGNIFGYDNVIVIDNGSTDERVLDIYRKYVLKGVHLKIDDREHRNCTKNMTEQILQWKGQCEWMFILETDEFLFWTPTVFDKTSKLPIDKIKEFLKNQPDDVSILRYKNFWKSCVNPNDYGYVNYKYQNPPAEIVYFENQDWDKIIVRMDRFSHMLQWPHHANAIHGKRIIIEELGLLHYHSTGSRRDWERNLNTMKGYKYFNIELPINIQSAICKFLLDKQAEGYHRMEKYMIMLHKNFAMDMFKLIIGRLPDPKTELPEIINLKNNDMMIYYILKNMDKYNMYIPNKNYTEEDILFYEERTLYTFEIHQVKNTLLDL